MSSERHTTCSKIIPMVKGLYQHLADEDESDDEDETQLLEESKKFKKELFKNLKKYFMETDKHGMNFEKNKVCAIATLLDPRFPLDVFSDQSAIDQAIKWTKDELIKLEVYAHPDTSTPANTDDLVEPTVSVPPKKQKTSKLWDKILANSTVTPPKKTPMSQRLDNVMDELERFLAKGVMLDLRMDPLIWWSNVGKEMFPLLWRTAIKHLIVPGKIFLN